MKTWATKMFDTRNTVEVGALPGQVQLQVGDVVRMGAELGVCMVVRVTPSVAQVASQFRKQYTITDRVFGTTKTFEKKADPSRISTTLDKELVLERQGDAGLAHFLTHGAVRGFEECGKQKQNHAAEGNSTMKTDKKNKKAAKSSANGETTRGAASSGSLGEFTIGEGDKARSFSTCAVLRRLGMAGVSVAHARAIMKAKKVKANDTTVSIQVGKGARGDGVPADLSKAEVEELKALAPEPTAEPKADKKAKAKTAKKKAAKKAATEKAATETTEAAAPEAAAA